MTTLPPRTIADLDVKTAVLEQRIRASAGHLAEYRHLLHDADPDSTVPVFVDLTKHQPKGAL